MIWEEFLELVNIESNAILLRRGDEEIKLKRSSNSRGTTSDEAFVLGVPSIKDQNICLFDDIVASGSTLRKCAEGLRLGGASHVFGLAIAMSTPRLIRNLTTGTVTE